MCVHSDAAKLAALMQNFAAEFQDVDNWDTHADAGGDWQNHDGIDCMCPSVCGDRPLNALLRFLAALDSGSDEDGEEFIVYQAAKGQMSGRDACTTCEFVHDLQGAAVKKTRMMGLTRPHNRHA